MSPDRLEFRSTVRLTQLEEVWLAPEVFQAAPKAPAPWQPALRP